MPSVAIRRLLTDSRQSLRIHNCVIFTVRGRIWNKCSSATSANLIVSSVQCGNSLVLSVLLECVIYINR